MTKYMNVVRQKVKDGQQDQYLKVMNESFHELKAIEGCVSSRLIKTGPQTFCYVGEWKSEEFIAKARPQMISMLDKIRDLLEEISPELGVTDPVSGSVIFE